jgi:hypothetical protein
MAVETHSGNYFDQYRRSPREELFLDDHRVVNSDGEVVYPLPHQAHLFGRRVLQHVDNRHYIYDELNRSHDTFMRRSREVMRRRLYFEAEYGTDNVLPNDLEDEVTSLYGEAGAHIKKLHAQYSLERTHHVTTQDATKRNGNMSEAIFFALFARSMRGEPVDPVIVIPTTPAVDQMGYSGGYKQGYDFHVLQRGGEPVKLQVKSSNASLGHHKDADIRMIKRYNPDILVLTLEGIAGSKQNVRSLPNAIMHELDGSAAFNEIQLIENSSHTLHKAIDQHVEQMGTLYYDE